MFRRRHVPEDAVSVFEGVLAARGLSRRGLRPQSALEAWLAFARTPFVLPRQPDADGLLYQYGTHAFVGEPRFHLDLVRQFAVAGEDEHLQFHCELVFAPTESLLDLGAGDEWWFQGGDLRLEQWASGLRVRPEWLVLAKHEPLAVELALHRT